MHTILQLSDTHLFADPDRQLFGVNSCLSLARIIAHAQRAFKPSVVLATGDLVHDESAAGYHRLRVMLESFDAPVLCLPGNHDDPERMRQLLIGPRVRCDKSIDAGRWRIVTLDTHVTGQDGGELVCAELDYLERELSAATDRHVVIALHHPPVPIGSPWMDAIGLANNAAFFDVIDRHAQVRVIVFGHIHQAFDAWHRQVRLLGAPSTCAQFKPRTTTHMNDPVPPGYRWLRLLDDGALETGVIRVTVGDASA